MNRIEENHLPVAAQSHPGRRGKNNEDRFGVFSYLTGGQNPVPVLVAILADGIGGHRAGEVAAEMAVRQIDRYIAASDGSNPPQILEEAIESASEEIFRRAQSQPEQQGMGSTCAVAWITANRLFIATVGDSRIYLLRSDHIQQLTIDHTWIQEAIERGLIKPEEAEGHPNTHVIRRYLGSPTPPQVDFRLRLTEEQGSIQAIKNQGLPLQPGDIVLLCSDGLSDLVEAEEILTAFRRESSMGSAVEDLIALANDRGGHDNITIVAIHMEPLPEGITAVLPKGTVGEITAPIPVGASTAVRPATSTVPAAATAPAAPARPAFRRMRPLMAGCLSALILLALFTLLAGGYWLYQAAFGPSPTPTNTPPITLEAPGAIPTLVTPTPSRPTVRPTRTLRLTPTSRTPAPGAATLTPWPTNTPWELVSR